MQALYETKLNLPLIQKGKVRDIYAIGDKNMLIVTTDRISAFDVVLEEPIAGKGAVLTTISNFWFNKTKHIVANHLDNMALSNILTVDEANQVGSRAIIVKKLKPLPVEAIVRGYLIGSGWKDYQKTGAVCGIKLPPNLELAGKLPQAIYTPSTKADIGEHDQNINYTETIKLIGENLAKKIRNISIEIYNFAAKYALKRGIIIADTKFEFGLDENDNLLLMDEVLTPDSSRFWSRDDYQVGTSPMSFDKQIVRDYLETCNWDKTPPAPKLPAEIANKTSAKYQQVQQLLCQ